MRADHGGNAQPLGAWPSARLFSIAWSALLIFTVVNLLALNGVLPLNAWTLNGQLIGMFTEFVLLSMALAERINIERNRRIAAQQLALETSESLAAERALHLQAKQEALDLQLQANEVLEARVYERTRALEEARQGLETANAELLRLSATDALTQLANRRRFDACWTRRFAVPAAAQPAGSAAGRHRSLQAHQRQLWPSVR